MRRHIAQLLLHLLILATLGAATSCAVPAAAVLTTAAPVAHAGTAAYISNELISVFEQPRPDTLRAVYAAMTELRFEHEVTREGGNRTYTLFRAQDGTDLEVRLESITPVLTRIGIRYGFLGDQAVSRAVLNAIERHVKRLQEPPGDTKFTQPETP